MAFNDSIRLRARGMSLCTFLVGLVICPPGVFICTFKSVENVALESYTKLLSLVALCLLICLFAFSKILCRHEKCYRPEISRVHLSPWSHRMLNIFNKQYSIQCIRNAFRATSALPFTAPLLISWMEVSSTIKYACCACNNIRTPHSTSLTTMEHASAVLETGNFLVPAPPEDIESATTPQHTTLSKEHLHQLLMKQNDSYHLDVALLETELSEVFESLLSLRKNAINSCYFSIFAGVVHVITAAVPLSMLWAAHHWGYYIAACLFVISAVGVSVMSFFVFHHIARVSHAATMMLLAVWLKLKLGTTSARNVERALWPKPANKFARTILRIRLAEYAARDVNRRPHVTFSSEEHVNRRPHVACSSEERVTHYEEMLQRCEVPRNIVEAAETLDDRWQTTDPTNDPVADIPHMTHTYEPRTVGKSTIA